jgi:hypothetical protein
MKYAHALILVLLIGCSSPGPKKPTTIYEWYQQFSTNETYNGLQKALAGPDVRLFNGEFRKAIHDQYVFRTPGFNAAARANLKDAINAAVEACEKQIGKNDCYVYVENNTYVRIAERKKWLKRNPTARRTIAAEKQKDQERRKLAAQRPAPTNFTTPANTTPDYDKADALFEIANQALQSTLPQQSNTVQCNTILNPMGGTTTCR